MDVTKILHMKKGDGDTSYAKNSELQNNILCMAKPIIEEAVLELLCSSNVPIQSMGIADLGCSSGPNTLLLISEVMDVIYSKSCSLGLLSSTSEFRVFLNDLFSNDFNTIFVSLPEFYNKLKEKHHKGSSAGIGLVFISAVPGSFYGRLFPAKSLHFVHSSSSLHWLSQAPPTLYSKEAGTALNKGQIYITKSSPQCVLDAYSLQFHNDFSLFLKSRAEEIVEGGRMVLTFLGRPSSDPATQDSPWEFFSHALMAMVSEGVIEEEKVDSFNAPYYAPCAEEVKLEVEKEGSFIMLRMEAFKVDWDWEWEGAAADDEGMHNTVEMAVGSGQRVAKMSRAVSEPMLESHFGKEIMDDLFQRFAALVGNHLSKTRTKYTNFVISLIRN